MADKVTTISTVGYFFSIYSCFAWDNFYVTCQTNGFERTSHTNFHCQIFFLRIYSCTCKSHCLREDRGIFSQHTSFPLSFSLLAFISFSLSDIPTLKTIQRALILFYLFLLEPVFSLMIHACSKNNHLLRLIKYILHVNTQSFNAFFFIFHWLFKCIFILFIFSLSKDTLYITDFMYYCPLYLTVVYILLILIYLCPAFFSIYPVSIIALYALLPYIYSCTL